MSLTYHQQPRPQQVTRIPPYRPGSWVRLKTSAPEGLAGRVRRVKSLTCALTEAGGPAVWRVHFDDGRCVEWHAVERAATEAEVRGVGRRA